jgi:hypothetical protein
MRGPCRIVRVRCHASAGVSGGELSRRFAALSNTFQIVRKLGRRVEGARPSSPLGFRSPKDREYLATERRNPSLRRVFARPASYFEKFRRLCDQPTRTADQARLAM